MSTTLTGHADTPASARTRKLRLPARLPLTLAILAFAAWLAWSVSARQGLLLLVGTGLGAALASPRFGFTTGWRNLVEARDPSGVYGQIVLIGLLALLSMPLLGRFPETTAALGPLSVSLLVGAFVFGAAMQVADGCGSGQLYKAGLGIPLNMAMLPMFVLGSFVGSAHLNGWLALGALAPVGLVDVLGSGGALATTLLALAAVALGVGWWSGQPFNLRRIPRRWLWGAVALALLAALNLLIAGQPWGIVYGFGLWGAKAATALGLFDPAANAFWSDPGHAERLRQTLLLDVTSITDIGILGAVGSSAPPRPPARRSP
ncbi:MAG: YeeE/YedE family protein [Burkholderiales bacterium]|nr:YeeE/YedE family protein [Burkholderiales bacterium]